MTEHEQLVWMSGFFDGEGSVGIARQRRTDRKSETASPFSYVLGMAVCQKERLPLEIFHQHFGGKLYPYVVRGVTYHRWYTWGSIALRALETLAPYLILKKERATVAIEFQKSLMAWNREYGRRGYPDFVNCAREEFFQRMKELNKRGVTTDNPSPRRPGVKQGSKNHFTKSAGGGEAKLIQ